MPCMEFEAITNSYLAFFYKNIFGNCLETNHDRSNHNFIALDLVDPCSPFTETISFKVVSYFLHCGISIWNCTRAKKKMLCFFCVFC